MDRKRIRRRRAAGDESATTDKSATPRLVAQAEEHAAEPVVQRSKIDTSILIPSGLAMLNCACTDNPHGAFALGQVVTVPGASQGGKTILMLTILAEICRDPRFDDYDLIYDDSEETVDRFDIPYLFGEALADRLKAPEYSSKGDPIHSNTIQDAKAHLLGQIQLDKKTIYVLDSLDALTSSEEVEREYKALLAKAKSDEAVKELAGSYKAEKAKGIGEALRMLTGHLKHSKSALFITQQIRQKFGATKFERKWVTSGGNAPYFYSVHQIYMEPGAQHKPEHEGFKLKTGNRVWLELTKNKLTGKERKVQVDIFNDYGMDDIGSCVDFLIKAKVWSNPGGWIDTQGMFGKKYHRDELLITIANENAIKELHELTGNAWLQVEELFRINRPRRY